MEGKPKCKEFKLDGIGSFTNNPAGTGLAFSYESGAAPLTVTHDSPEGNVLVFELPQREGVGEAYFVDKHRYKMTLVAKRTTKKWLVLPSEPLKGAISVVANKDALDLTADCSDVGLTAPLYRPSCLTVGIVSHAFVPQYTFMRSSRHSVQCHRNTL